MSFMNVDESPMLFVVLIGVVAFSIAHLIWATVRDKVKFKNQGNKELVMYTIYTTTGCILLSWTCIFLGQAKPMIKPE
ncbi:hypothetical protein NEOKW01_0875 [Nematocida sp. AWRm80]|nr:hypothetical protein NEOKW01_0875 [Nematocida sp. AWRm80]